ncbi:MAG: helix-turn-helix domain-containing protein [Micromonosporaceae bacterium]
MLLGTQLRRLREQAGITLEDAGHAIRASHSKMSRIELGRVGFKERDVADLLTLYGVTDEKQREAALKLAREANTPGWWHNYADVLPDWFETYVAFEEVATRIRAYEVQFVPGLLQTEEYTHAVARLGHPQASKNEIERRVTLRMARQKLLTDPGAPHLWTVLDEAALRRCPCGPAGMREQLRRLITANAMPNVTIQVLPFRAGGHPAGAAFTILRFAEAEIPDVVYLEQLTSALYLEKQDAVDSYQLVMESLCVRAAPPPETERILGEMLRAL